MVVIFLPTASATEVWEALYRSSPQYKRYVTDRLQAAGNVSAVSHARPRQPAKQKVSSTAQFGVLARRYFDLVRRDTGSLIILLAAMPLIGLLLLVMADRYDLTGKSETAIRSEIQQDIREARRDDPGNDAEQFQGIYQVASSYLTPATMGGETDKQAVVNLFLKVLRSAFVPLLTVKRTAPRCHGTD